MSKFFQFKFIVIFFLLHASTNIDAKSQGQHLLVFGDSLSAAYGMDVEEGWAHLLKLHWTSNGSGHKMSNASISGETTDGGLARLALTLEEIQPDVVILELGANDGLRNHPLSRIRNNLEKMVVLIKEAGAQPLMAGISLPPSLGPRYIDGFRQIFSQVAEQAEIPFIDFYREDFFTTAGYMQADGLHPTALPQPIIRDSLLGFFAEHSLFQ